MIQNLKPIISLTIVYIVIIIFFYYILYIEDSLYDNLTYKKKYFFKITGIILTFQKQITVLCWGTSVENNLDKSHGNYHNISHQTSLSNWSDL